MRASRNGAGLPQKSTAADSGRSLGSPCPLLRRSPPLRPEGFQGQLAGRCLLASHRPLWEQVGHREPSVSTSPGQFCCWGSLGAQGDMGYSGWPAAPESQLGFGVAGWSSRAEGKPARPGPCTAVSGSEPQSCGSEPRSPSRLLGWLKQGPTVC